MVTHAIEFPTFQSLNVIPDSCGGSQRRLMSPIEITEIPHEIKPQKKDETSPIRNMRTILASSTMKKFGKIYRENRKRKV